MLSIKICSQITVNAFEYPELHRFMSDNKNKHFVSRRIKEFAEKALVDERSISTNDEKSRLMPLESSQPAKFSTAVTTPAKVDQKKMTAKLSLPKGALQMWQNS